MFVEWLKADFLEGLPCEEQTHAQRLTHGGLFYERKSFTSECLAIQKSEIIQWYHKGVKIFNR